MLSVLYVVAGHCPALPVGAADRRLDGLATSRRQETAPKPVKVLGRSFGNLSRDKTCSLCGCPVTTNPQDTLSRLQEARIVLIPGEIMIALHKAGCEQPLIGNRRILPSYQEPRYQIDRASTGIVGRQGRHVLAMDHECSLHVRLAESCRSATPPLVWDLAHTARLCYPVTDSGKGLQTAS